MKKDKDPFDKALSYAYRLLSIKERSRKELESKLRGKGYGAECAGKVLDNLAGKRLISDERFAREWIKASSTYRPKGIRAIKDELARKGLDRSLVEEALKDEEIGYDECAVARALAEKRSGSIAGMDGARKKKYIFGYLARRGFSYDVINDIIDGI